MTKQNKARFTPGPWEVAPIKDGYFPSVKIGPVLPYTDGSGSRGHEICINEGQPPETSTWDNRMQTCIANAHLIAAAPEMYAALKACQLQLLQSGDHHEYTEQALNLAETAIRKAEGK